MRHIKRRELFTKEVDTLLHRLGAKSDPTWNYPWPHYKIETEAGPLGLSVHNDLYMADKEWAKGGLAPWVSGRFENVKAARKVVDSNPFTGKWNHHYWHNWTDDFQQGFDLLEYELRRIIK